MAGRTSRYQRDEMENTFIDNLRYAADRLQKVSAHYAFFKVASL